MARSPELMALLDEARRSAHLPGMLRSQEEVEADIQLTAEEEAEAQALAASWRAEHLDGDIEDETKGHDGAADGGRPAGRRSAPAGSLSGRLVVRLPKSVHRELADRAKVEGVSLNQLILTYVARGLGADAAASP